MHSSLGNKSETPSQKKKIKRNLSCFKGKYRVNTCTGLMHTDEIFDRGMGIKLFLRKPSPGRVWWLMLGILEFGGGGADTGGLLDPRNLRPALAT